MSVQFGLEGKSNKETTCNSDAVAPNTIAKQLKPLVNTLRFMCGYPIFLIKSDKQKAKTKHSPGGQKYFTKNDHQTGIQYELVHFKWTCPWMWYSYIFKVLNILMLTSFVCNAALDIPFPAKLLSFGPSFYTLASATAVKFDIFAFVFAAILKVVEITVTFFNSKELIVWLNNWRLFEKKFSNCFNAEDKIKFLEINKFQKKVLLYITYIPFLVFVFVWIPFMATSFVLHVEYLSAFVLACGVLALWHQQLVEESKFHILFWTTVVAIEQVRFGVVKKNQRDSVEASDVADWRNLVILLRKQTSILCSCIKGQQLIHAADLIISCSMGLSCLLLALGEGDLFKIFSIPFLGKMAHCSTNLVKLYLKVLHAERIPAQELSLAAELLSVEEKCKVLATKTELKFLHNMLTQNTVKVNLGNYCALDKKLLLQIGVQVVTYLIVIIQFERSSDAKI